MKREVLIKEGGQSYILRGRRFIRKIFKNLKTYQRENFLHIALVQPLNSMHIKKPFVIAYPKNNPNTKEDKQELKMEIYEGDITVYLKNNPNMYENQIRLFFVRMVYPVYILHFNRIFHGDLKPDNFLFQVSKDDQKTIHISLSDFGGAYWLNSRYESIYQPFCYSDGYHPVNLLDNNHPPFNPFLADCVMLGKILYEITSHLKEKSCELNILIAQLLNWNLEIEDVLNHPWILRNSEARELINHLSKTNSNAIYGQNNDAKYYNKSHIKCCLQCSNSHYSKRQISLQNSTPFNQNQQHQTQASFELIQQDFSEKSKNLPSSTNFNKNDNHSNQSSFSFNY